jgi:hypothetical protein
MSKETKTGTQKKFMFMSKYSSTLINGLMDNQIDLNT